MWSNMKKTIENDGYLFFFSSRRRHTRLQGDWSSDVCSSDLVVMEVAPRFSQNPQTLADIYVMNKSGGMVPLSAFASFGPGSTPLSVNHHGQFEIGRASCRERV